MFTGSRNQGENILGVVAQLTTLASLITAALHIQLHWFRADRLQLLPHQGVAAVGGWNRVSVYFSKSPEQLAHAQ